ncbi:hypothetical protein ASPZODRAFT_14788 [Penicilliopsis zonata CBS 506.65]|uniref:Aminoglycoside phosphotransferase domain-containing protein n=1 Tax=Penicilliopsis zonata CBS 506.65 TaxID=1073090 RepID=A0A1L9SN23_9EURO|nr:hypothetical protein ASPZODRAFT_14788 [Penicilliopsis zonata CBS 506.65]OJJ48659.1 hypothetical protein ASPZODRAFT_14788 [Penicilliopsis zonata CBS 506.65]
MAEKTLITFIQNALSLSNTPLTIRREPSIEGDDHKVFFIDGHDNYILRVTKPRPGRGYSGSEMQRREIAIHDLIRSEYERRGLSSAMIPRSVASCILDDDKDGDETTSASLEVVLKGATLDDVPATSRTLTNLTTLLVILRSIPVSRLEERLGVKVPMLEYPELMQWRSDAVEAWRRLVRNDQLGGVNWGVPPETSLEEYIETKTAFMEEIRAFSLGNGKDDEIVLTHNDIKGEHILISHTDGSITGILDWADVGLGSPAIDIAGVLLTVGTTATIKVAREAGYGEKVILEGIMFGRCMCVTRLDDRLNGNDTQTPVPLLKQQLLVSLQD